jgi:hypothetical protein
MARLIPAFMDDRTPPGEREVFNLIAAGPDDWVVIHSLDLAPWNRGLRTEIDFVVIAPQTGVLCLEVKSHDTISFEQDRWHPSEIKRSPFKQAADARHTFHRRLCDIAPHFRHVPTVHCCIFPRAGFDIRPTLSVQPWELIDARLFRAFRSGIEFCADLETRMRRAIAADQVLEPLGRALSPSQVDSIIKLCLPVQQRRVRAREEIERCEHEMDRILRDQQKPVLQLATVNRRLVVSGAAGTGKTLIAMEVARRVADRGTRVALVCFNQLIGEWIRSQVERSTGGAPNLVAGRAIRIMSEMCGIPIPTEPPASYWDQELPQQIQERLTDPDFTSIATFDYLVVDEAQDLLAKPSLWESLTSFLSGGLAEGSFCLFGDFDNQVLGARDAMARTLASLHEIAHPAVYRLAENCRNYRIIADSAVRLSGLRQPVYDGYLRSGGGIRNYDIFFYRSDDEQHAKLAQWLKEFRAEGYRPAEITILSFRAADESIAARMAAEGFKLRPQWQQASNATGYCSVHAFKGLENRIIILTDVVLGEPDFLRDLFYIGMTRACESVRVLCHSNSQDTLTRWLAGTGR